MLGRCPRSCASPPSATRGCSTQAQALAGTDVVRLLDLVSAALEATANGAQPRIQLELVLIKAAAPEVDPSTAALLARIERLEAALAGQRPAPRPVAAPGAHAAPSVPRRPSRRSQTVATAEASAAAPRLAAAAPPRRPAPAETAAPPGSPRPRRRRRATARRRPGRSVRPARPSSQTVDRLLARRDRPRPQGQPDAGGAPGRRAPGGAPGARRDVAFPSGKAFLKRKAEQDDYRRATAEALRSVIGSPLALRYELRDEPEPADPPPSPAASPTRSS